MSEQSATNQSGLADAASENNPSAAGERPSSGAERRVDPAEPTPAANQRAGERSVGAESSSEPDDGVNNAEQPAQSSTESQQPITATGDVPERRQGADDASSSGAAAGEVPVPQVEQAHHDAAAQAGARTDERPVTGVHRPAAPSGEVSPA
jgi:hypothetical protein